MPLNYGRIIQTIPGIQGVVAGGQAQVQINPQRRVCRMNFQAQGIAYVAPIVTLPASAGGTPATFTTTVVAGVITAVAIATAGSGQTPGTYTAVVTDTVATVDGNINNSYAANITIVVAGGGTVTAVPTVVSGGVVSAVPIEIFFNGQILQTVGGVNMRDTTATNIKLAAYTDDIAQVWDIGQLSIYYVYPKAEFTENPEATVFDLWGQSVLQIQMPITPNITSPGLVGVYEFDNDITLRKTSLINGVAQPVLQPIAEHAQSFAVPAGASLFSITTVPFLLAPNVPLPIMRLLFTESNPGHITQIEIDQDGNKIVQLTQAQIKQMYKDYRFNTGVVGAFYVADIDHRIYKALRCQQNLVIWVSSSVAQQVGIIRQTLPGAYSGG